MSRTSPSWRLAYLLAGGLALLALPQARAADSAAAPPIELTVDATEAGRRIYHVRLVIPARPGPLTLYYPKWIPGTHAPVGPISNLAGLKIQAGGKTIRWRRDDVDAFAFHCRVPEGAGAVEAAFDVVMGPGRWAPTPHLAALVWHPLLVYPKGQDAGRVRVRATLRLPAGWKLSTALPVESRQDATTRFAPVSLETLIDAPVLCGSYFREVPIGPDTSPRHLVVLAADSEAALELSPELKAGCDRLVAEAGALFGCRPYRSYRFLLALSDHLSWGGLEHHESSDNHMAERSLLEAPGRALAGYLFAHEYVHTWCGKYRRPADMVTADFQQPQRTRLLWVYEGLTDYLAFVLTGRARLWRPEASRDYLAMTADGMQGRRGRTWRPLEDVTTAAHVLGDGAGWDSWRRTNRDYYAEGTLLWLEVDMRIRAQTKGQRSLDDFCRRFLGGQDGAPRVAPYTFDDLVVALQAVAPYDWKGFLTRRVATTAEQAPLDGIRLGGWRLGYGEEPSETFRSWNAAFKQTDLGPSLGLFLRPDGTVTDVIPGTPADRAGVAPGMKLLAVNGRRWSEPRLLDAVKATKASGRIELLLENEDYFRTCTLSYQGGLRYPRLERQTAGGPDRLTELLKPRAGTKKVK
jgi:predicted metalloprotease with PDZ domain